MMKTINFVSQSSLTYIACLLLPCFSSIAAAETITFGSAKDNALFEDTAGSLSNGAGPHTYVGNTNGAGVRRGLMQFAVANHIPAGATIDSVSLSLYLSKEPRGGGTPTPISLHRFTADWGESSSNAGSPGGTGAPAEAGDATWLHRFFPNDFWSTPGGDFDPLASATTIVDNEGEFYEWSTAQMAVDVQDWLDSPASDFGWLLHGDESVSTNARRFDTREVDTPAFRPALTVEFTPIPEPSGSTSLLIAALIVAWGGSRQKL